MFDVQCLHCTVAVAKCAQLCCHFKTKQKKKSSFADWGHSSVCKRVLAVSMEWVY